MRLSTRKIPPEGLDMPFAVSAESMAFGMREDDLFFDLFENDVECQLHFEIEKNDVFLSGTAYTELHPTCDRCGEDFTRPISVDLALTCSPERGWHGSDCYQESDEGMVFYAHEELDLTQIIREQVLLSMPMRWLCRPDCEGLCTTCGANMNHGDHTGSCRERQAV